MRKIEMMERTRLKEIIQIHQYTIVLRDTDPMLRQHHVAQQISLDWTDLAGATWCCRSRGSKSNFKSHTLQKVTSFGNIFQNEVKSGQINPESGCILLK